MIILVSALDFVSLHIGVNPIYEVGNAGVHVWFERIPTFKEP